MTNVSEIYGSMVFNEHVMAERLPSVTYKSLMRTIEQGEPLDIAVEALKKARWYLDRLIAKVEKRTCGPTA